MRTHGDDPWLTPSRLARRAVVYVWHVWQSTQTHVECDRGSREPQRARVDRARSLGWKRVADLGTGAAPRQVLERRLAVFALCAIAMRSDKEVGDSEQLDAFFSSFDDQRILGTKGTPSVAEPKMLRQQRLLACTCHESGTGELHRALSPGCLLDALGKLLEARLVEGPDRDQRVLDVMALVFRTVRETGSIRPTHQRSTITASSLRWTPAGAGGPEGATTDARSHARPPSPRRRTATRVAVSSFARVSARREDELEQISLAILLDRRDAPAISLRPEQRRKLLDLMVAAIIAVHRACEGDAGKEGDDDDERE